MNGAVVGVTCIFAQQKARHFRAGLFYQLKSRLGGLDVGGLFALWSLSHFKADFLAFLKRLEAVHVDRRKVCEQIFAAVIGSNKTKTLCVVEPFNYACCHVITSLLKNGKVSRKTI